MISFEVKLSERSLKFLDDFGNFRLTPMDWELPISRLHGQVSEIIEKMNSATVSSTTIKWRKQMAKKGNKVETLLGKKRRVLDSSQVGDRTGSLFAHILDRTVPGVRASLLIATELSSYKIEVLSDKYSKRGSVGYPEKFEEYAISRGLAPEEGLLAISDEGAAFVLDALESAVWKKLFKGTTV